MKRTLTASISQDGEWFVAQCLEVDVASQGMTSDEAIANLREALELHVEPAAPTILTDLHTIEVEIGAASRGLQER